ncbi:hypothetical protein [Magnetospirillum sp. 15-1]|uniref:hypothetical protein n=1 Tax=Magnetospirillum sp. 15-1 TaxID=1979370 RepID=UPI000BBC9DAB|nr:hypothetical protein [Magnetospirillum sp. 15-1]
MAVLYLGINGVLLRSNGTLAPHAGTFLRWAIERHMPFWLTSRDLSGSHAGIVAAFKDCAELEPLLPAVTPLAWTGTKTVAIDMDADFYWIAANPPPADHQALDHHDKRARWVEVDVNVFPDALLAAMTVVDVLCGG